MMSPPSLQSLRLNNGYYRLIGIYLTVLPYFTTGSTVKLSSSTITIFFRIFGLGIRAYTN